MVARTEIFIAERDLIFDDHMDCGVRLNARGRSFGYYLNNARVERLENMTLTEANDAGISADGSPVRRAWACRPS